MKNFQSRMKIFPIFIHCLISGQVWCSDVFGYSGGAVIIISDLQWDLNNTRYVCKVEPSGCQNIMKDQTRGNFVNEGRFRMYGNTDGKFLVLIKELSPQDTAVYRFGVGPEQRKDISLTVQNDACCGGIKKMSACLGETVTMKCNYPEEFTQIYKYFTKFDPQIIFQIYTDPDPQKVQKDRFSIFDDRKSEVFSVNISDVREEDGGVYSCGVWRKTSVGYFSYFSHVHLQVPEKATALPESPSTAVKPTSEVTYRSTTAAAMETLSDGEHSSSSAIIPVCVCVTLLLIGGSVLIFYKLRKRAVQESALAEQRSHKDATAGDGEEHGPRRNKSSVSLGLIYKSPEPNSDPVYQNFDPRTSRSDPVYESMVDTSQSV